MPEEAGYPEVQPMKRNAPNIFIIVTLLMLLLGMSSNSQAIVSANSRLTIEGTELNVSVTVIVNLKGSQPEIALISTVHQSDDSVSEWVVGASNKIVYTYTITAIANGPDGYTLSPEVNGVEGDGNLAGAGEARLNTGTNKVNLGATAVLAVDGQMITVPSDGGLSGKNIQKVNGTEAGDKVAVGGSVYWVEAEVDDNEEDTTITPPEQLPECYECPCTLIAEWGQFKEFSIA